jgi:hypothetical protein
MLRSNMDAREPPGQRRAAGQGTGMLCRKFCASPERSAEAACRAYQPIV